MLNLDKKDGYSYTSERTGRSYDLLEGTSLGGKTTSDICIIFDWMHDENEENCEPSRIVNFFFGATSFLKGDRIEELNEIVKSYVDEYESKNNY